MVENIVYLDLMLPALCPLPDVEKDYVLDRGLSQMFSQYVWPAASVQPSPLLEIPTQFMFDFTRNSQTILDKSL